MNKPKVKTFCVVFAALCFLSACGDGEHEDLQAWIDSVGNDQRGKIPPLPKIRTYVPVTYSVSSSLDPFDDAKLEPDIKGGYAQGKGAPDFDAREARNNILERYSLENMRMIGYLNINNQPMAVVFVDQLTKQVKVGDWIGLDFGRVLRVTDQEVELEETIQNADGDWSTRNNSLQLQTGEGG
ncbi:MAG: pilus assembly protein PilP [Zoogloeaceae bacterium]|jgi:type IV pilus assembly protein PilP|nr:pilus assembly protein PilP [Zoogloeaceae bacterium]